MTPAEIVHQVPRDLIPELIAALAVKLQEPEDPGPPAVEDLHRCLTPQEVATYLGLSVKTVYNRGPEMGRISAPGCRSRYHLEAVRRWGRDRGLLP